MGVNASLPMLCRLRFRKYYQSDNHVYCDLNKALQNLFLVLSKSFLRYRYTKYLGRIFRFKFLKSIHWLWRYNVWRKKPFPNLLSKIKKFAFNVFQKFAFNVFLRLQKRLLRQMLHLQSQWMDFKNSNGVWKLKRFCITCINLIFKFLSK